MDYKKELKKRKHMAVRIIDEFAAYGNPLPDVFVEYAGRIAILPTHIASGSTIDWQFAGNARKHGFIPLWAQYLGDQFQSCNGRKTMYLHTWDKLGNRYRHTNPHKWNGHKLSDIILDNGESLVEYHNALWQDIPGTKLICDLSAWLQFFGASHDYYYHVRKLNLALGVEFWPSNITGLYRDGEKDALYAMIKRTEERLCDEYGVQPLIIEFPLQPSLYGGVS